VSRVVVSTYRFLTDKTHLLLTSWFHYWIMNDVFIQVEQLNVLSGMFATNMSFKSVCSHTSIAKRTNSVRPSHYIFWWQKLIGYNIWIKSCTPDYNFINIFKYTNVRIYEYSNLQIYEFMIYDLWFINSMLYKLGLGLGLGMRIFGCFLHITTLDHLTDQFTLFSLSFMGYMGEVFLRFKMEKTSSFFCQPFNFKWKKWRSLFHFKSQKDLPHITHET